MQQAKGSDLITTSVSIPEFVIQEAKEKNFEIEVKALKQFELEKKAIVDNETLKIQQDYENRMKDLETEYRIQKSNSINKSRLDKMETRNKAMIKIFSEAQFRLQKKIQNDQVFYKNLLVNLIAQGLVKLLYKSVKIRCLQRDEHLVKEAMPLAQKKYEELMVKDLGIENYKVQLELDTSSYLILRQLKDNSEFNVRNYTSQMGQDEIIPKNEDDRQCVGGVVLCNMEGNIICKNTIDVRIDLCFQDSLPQLRALLFPDKKEEERKQKKKLEQQQNKHH